MKWNLLIVVTFCVFASGFADARTPQAATEQRCGIDLRQPAQRVFAKVDDQQPWREYKRLEDVPELALGFGISAEMWRGAKQTFLISTDEPGDDFDAYTEYCFDKGGKLISLAYELRTAWGWAFRMGGLVQNGDIHTDSIGFFSTKTEKPIPKPQSPVSADEVRNALKPTLFLQANQLPFFELLSR
jgi:hypothetical protein